MSTVTGIIEGTGQNVSITIPTKRIPELPPVALPYDVADKLPLYDNSEGKTVFTSIEDFITYLNSGGATPVAPVVYGADIEITITAGEAGGYRVTRLPLAGKMYSLERRGLGYLKTSEFLILPSGGFELTNHDDLVQEGEFFVAHVYNYIQNPGNGNTSSSFINGMLVVSSTIDLDNTSYNKLIHVAGGSNKVIITLPDLADCKNLIFPFETMLGNNYQTKILARAGQKIYFGNTSSDYVYLGISEYIWLIAGADGWYAMKASEGLLNVGQPFFDYRERLNSIAGKGQLVAKDSVPRLVDILSSNPDMVVSETFWQAYPENRAKFTFYDATSIRFPDLQNYSFRGLNNIGGTDSERPGNTVGLRQLDKVGKHKHTDISGDTASHASSSTALSGIWKWLVGLSDTGNGTAQNSGTGDTGENIGSETRGKNIGLLPLIKI